MQQTKVPKSPKGLPFKVFRHYETVQNSHFSFFIWKFFIKSNLFVSKGYPLRVFWYFATNWIWKSLKGPRFTILKTLLLLSLWYSADFRRSSLVFLKLKFPIAETFIKLKLFSDVYTIEISSKVFEPLISKSHVMYLMYDVDHGYNTRREAKGLPPSASHRRVIKENSLKLLWINAAIGWNQTTWYPINSLQPPSDWEGLLLKNYVFIR